MTPDADADANAVSTFVNFNARLNLGKESKLDK